jgi:predicted nucleic acid-binding protein
LLDTSVVSELRKIGDGKADVNVVAWIEAEDAARFFISAITVLELLCSFASSLVMIFPFRL